MADLITQSDLEIRIGARAVAEFSDDDGDGVADVDVVAWALSTASREAEGALRPGFPTAAQVAAIVGADSAVLNLIVEIAAGLLGGRRISTLSADGKAPFEGWRERALKRLREIGAADARAAGEETGGGNALLRARVNPKRDMVFAATARDPKGPGGF